MQQTASNLDQVSLVRHVLVRYGRCPRRALVCDAILQMLPHEDKKSAYLPRRSEPAARTVREFPQLTMRNKTVARNSLRCRNTPQNCRDRRPFFFPPCLQTRWRRKPDRLSMPCEPRPARTVRTCMRGRGTESLSLRLRKYRRMAHCDARCSKSKRSAASARRIAPTSSCATRSVAGRREALRMRGKCLPPCGQQVERVRQSALSGMLGHSSGIRQRLARLSLFTSICDKSVEELIPKSAAKRIHWWYARVLREWQGWMRMPD